MRILLFAVLLTALTAGLARAGGGFHPTNRYSACAHSNSKACTDARNAFAEHHNGMYPQQWYNQWYQGHQGRWNQHNHDWRWEGADGDDYWKGNNGWQWRHARHKHERNDN